MAEDTVSTDKAKLEALLTEWGVPFVEDGVTPNGIQVGEGPFSVRHPKIRGYDEFYTTFVFNDDDSFKYMGAWE